MRDIEITDYYALYPTRSPSYRPKRCRVCGITIDCPYAILCEDCKLELEDEEYD